MAKKKNIFLVVFTATDGMQLYRISGRCCVLDHTSMPCYNKCIFNIEAAGYLLSGLNTCHTFCKKNWIPVTALTATCSGECFVFTLSLPYSLASYFLLQGISSIYVYNTVHITIIFLKQTYICGIECLNLCRYFF